MRFRHAVACARGPIPAAGARQLFMLNRTLDGAYTIENKHSGHCLEAAPGTFTHLKVLTHPHG